jgi:hypothetical protein
MRSPAAGGTAAFFPESGFHFEGLMLSLPRLFGWFIAWSSRGFWIGE